MQAALVGEGARADIGGAAVGRAVQALVEQARQMGQTLHRAVGLRPVSKPILSTSFGIRRDQVGVAAALAQPVERALDLARAGAHGGQRVGDRVLGVVVGVDAEPVARDPLQPPRRRCARSRAAACRRWCRTARSSARRPSRRQRGRPSRSRDWPCSRRRNARRRTSPRPCASWHGRWSRRSSRGISARSSSSATSTWKSQVLPTMQTRARLGRQDGGETGIVGGAAAGPAGHAEGGELGVLEVPADRRRRRSSVGLAPGQPPSI